jgi:methylmalonyl-CoA mutase
MGFDVDLGPLFQTPEEVAKQALENDVHIVGISTQAGGHKTLIPLLIDELKRQRGSDILIVAGGVIPDLDHEELYKMGVKAIFTPGTNLIEAALNLLQILETATP